MCSWSYTAGAEQLDLDTLQLELDSLGQGSCIWTAGAGQLEVASWSWTAAAGQLELDSSSETRLAVREGQLELAR